MGSCMNRLQAATQYAAQPRRFYSSGKLGCESSESAHKPQVTNVRTCVSSTHLTAVAAAC